MLKGGGIRPGHDEGDMRRSAFGRGGTDGADDRLAPYVARKIGGTPACYPQPMGLIPQPTLADGHAVRNGQPRANRGIPTSTTVRRPVHLGHHAAGAVPKYLADQWP